MKKIVVCVGGFLLGLSLWGQRVNHPALLFTKERVEAAKARVQSDTCMARCWADIRKVAMPHWRKTTSTGRIIWLWLI